MFKLLLKIKFYCKEQIEKIFFNIGVFNYKESCFKNLVEADYVTSHFNEISLINMINFYKIVASYIILVLVGS